MAMCVYVPCSSESGYLWYTIVLPPEASADGVIQVSFLRTQLAVVAVATAAGILSARSKKRSNS